MQHSLQGIDEPQSQDGAAKPDEAGPSLSHGSKVGTGRAVHAVGHAVPPTAPPVKGPARYLRVICFACRVGGWQPCSLRQPRSPRWRPVHLAAHHRAITLRSAQSLPGRPRTAKPQAASKPRQAPPPPLQCRHRAHQAPQQRCRLPGPAAGHGTAFTGLRNPSATIRKQMLSRSRAPSSMPSPWSSQIWPPRRRRPTSSCRRGRLASHHQQTGEGIISRPPLMRCVSLCHPPNLFLLYVCMRSQHLARAPT